MGGTEGRTDQPLLLCLSVALGMAAINQAIKEGKAAQTVRVLRNPSVALRGVVPDCANSYQRVLEGAMAKKRHPGNGPTLTLCLPRQPLATPEPSLLTWLCLGDAAFWVQHDMKDGTSYYFHLQTFQGTWERPPGCCLNTSHLTREEIQVGSAVVRERIVDGGFPAERVPPFQPGYHGLSLLPPQSAVTKVTAAHDRQQLWKANIGFVIQLQARLRGFLVRQKFAERSHFLRAWLPAIIRIQVAASGFLSLQDLGFSELQGFLPTSFLLSGVGMV